MSDVDFSLLVETGLLREVEEIVIDAHRRLAGRHSWSRPDAYRWLRYEDPDPVGQLGRGVDELRRRGAEFDVGAVDKACAKASKSGFSN